MLRSTTPLLPGDVVTCDSRQVLEPAIPFSFCFKYSIPARGCVSHRCDQGMQRAAGLLWYTRLRLPEGDDLVILVASCRSEWWFMITEKRVLLLTSAEFLYFAVHVPLETNAAQSLMPFTNQHVPVKITPPSRFSAVLRSVLKSFLLQIYRLISRSTASHILHVGVGLAICITASSSLVIYRRRSIERNSKLLRLHVCGSDSTWHEVKTSSLKRCYCIIIATVRLLTYHSRACVTDHITHCSSLLKPTFANIDQKTAKLLTKRQPCRPIRHHCHPQAHTSLSNNHPP